MVLEKSITNLYKPTLPGNYTGILGWSLAELTIGTIAASLPTVAFLFPSSKKGLSSNPQQSGFSKSGTSHKVNSFYNNKMSRITSHDGVTRGASKNSGSAGIMRTVEIDIELEEKKLGLSKFGSEERIVRVCRSSEEAFPAK